MAYKWQVFFLVAGSIFMSTLDSSIVNVALPYVMQDLGETMGGIQWVVTSYLLTVSSLLLVFGRLSDIRGRSQVYKIGFSVFTLGSFCSAVSPGTGWLVLSRVVQGMGAAMLMACSPALIVDAFEPATRGRALGLVGACVALGLTTGPLAGGLLLEYFSWRSIFYINLPVGMAALVWAGKVFGQQREEHHHQNLDLAGAGLMVLGIGALVFCLVRLPAWGVLSWETLGSLGVLLATAWAWGAHNRRAKSPLFDPALFRVPEFVQPLVGALLLFAALFSLIFLMPFYLSLACGFSPGRTGMVMISPFLSLLLVSPVAGALSDRFGTKFLCAGGFACLALAMFLLAGLGPEQGLPVMVLLLCLAGTGTALFISPNSNAVMGSVPGELRGVASGALATARNLGMVIGVSLSSTIFAISFARLTKGGRLDGFVTEMAPQFLTAFSHAMTAGAVVAVIGLALTLNRKHQSKMAIENDRKVKDE